MTLTLIIMLIPQVDCSKKEFMSNSPKIPFYQSDFDLDLDPMTLILNLDIDMVKMSHLTNNEVSLSRNSKVIVTDTQTGRHKGRQTV